MDPSRPIRKSYIEIGDINIHTVHLRYVTVQYIASTSLGHHIMEGRRVERRGGSGGARPDTAATIDQIRDLATKVTTLAIPGASLVENRYTLPLRSPAVGPGVPKASGSFGNGAPQLGP